MSDSEKSVLFLAIAQILNNQTIMLTNQPEEILRSAIESNRKIIDMFQKIIPNGDQHGEPQ